MSQINDMEALLRSALVPVEPSEALGDRLERGLSEITDAAAGELAEWERSAMGDPRAWGRLIAAVVVGGAAAGALVLIHARQQHQKRHVPPVRALQSGMRDVRSDLAQRLGR